MIDAYSFGKIKINGKSYSSDVIIYKDRVDSNWWRRDGHSLCSDDISEVFEANPDVLVVGTGYFGIMKVPEETIKHIESGGIELIHRKTGDAVKIYNEMVDKKNVVACLHLTC